MKKCWDLGLGLVGLPDGPVELFCSIFQMEYKPQWIVPKISEVLHNIFAAASMDRVGKDWFPNIYKKMVNMPGTAMIWLSNEIGNFVGVFSNVASLMLSRQGRWDLYELVVILLLIGNSAGCFDKEGIAFIFCFAKWSFAYMQCFVEYCRDCRNSNNNIVIHKNKNWCVWKLWAKAALFKGVKLINLWYDLWAILDFSDTSGILMKNSELQLAFSAVLYFKSLMACWACIQGKLQWIGGTGPDSTGISTKYSD